MNKTHVIILMTFVSLGIYMLFGFIRKLRTFLVKLNIDLKLSLYMYFISVFLTNISVIDTCISLNRRCSLQSVKSGTFYLSSQYVFSKKKKKLYKIQKLLKFARQNGFHNMFDVTIKFK